MCDQNFPIYSRDIINWEFLGSSEYGPALKLFYESEDTAGDILGAWFAYWYYDPEGTELEEQIVSFFRMIGAEDPRTLPESVFEPNWKQILQKLTSVVQKTRTHKDKK